MDADKVTRAVDRLVDMGYVIRNTDAADRRRAILCLTSRGRTVFEEIEELHQSMDAKWRNVLTKDENTELNQILSKLDARAREIFTDEMGNQLIKAVRSPRLNIAAGKTAKASAAKPTSKRRTARRA